MEIEALSFVMGMFTCLAVLGVVGGVSLFLSSLTNSQIGPPISRPDPGRRMSHQRLRPTGNPPTERVK